MGTQEIVAYIKLKLKRTTEMQGNDAMPNLGIIDLLNDLRQAGETNYFKLQDALQEMTNNGLVVNRDKGIVFFNTSVLN
jgi:hypothetical protein